MVALKMFFSVLFAGVLIAGSSNALEVGSNELISSAKDYDKKEIVYSGEVIGDIMKRGQNCWINISDGDNAIGVWAEESLAKNIKYKGSYKYIGDEVKVTGIFNKACPEHGGDLDIHAQKIEIIQKGYISKRPVNIYYILIAAILLVIAIIMNLIIFKKKL
ncbi:MAG: DNA-binding protein [Actinobacteria bacterium]|nr:DNA-binding protein [Actinomycetota bacterium]